MSSQDWIDEAAVDREAERAKRCAGGRPARADKARRCGQRKLECASCGFIARASIGALERCGFPSCGCGRTLELAEREDRIAAGCADAQLEAELEASHLERLELERYSAREMREAQREANYGFKTGAASCAVCGRFKSAPAAVCGYCGDAPAQYAADASSARDAAESYNRGAGYRL